MTTKTSKSVLTDDSVMMALGELRALEGQRLDQERAEKARAEVLAKAEAARRVEEAASAARQADAQRALAVSEMEARVRAEAAADVARDATALQLRAQLAQVQADRAALHQALEARAANALQGGAQQGHGWAMAFGLASVVAAGLAGLLAFQSSQPIAIPQPAPTAELTHAVVVDESTDERDELEAARAAVATPEPAPEREVAAAPTPRASARPHRAREIPAVRTERTEPRDDLDFGDDGDVLGHLSQTRGLR